MGNRGIVRVGSFGGMAVRSQLKMVGLLLNRDDTVAGVGLVRGAIMLVVMLMLMLTVVGISQVAISTGIAVHEVQILIDLPAEQEGSIGVVGVGVLEGVEQQPGGSLVFILLIHSLLLLLLLLFVGGRGRRWEDGRRGDGDTVVAGGEGVGGVDVGVAGGAEGGGVGFAEEGGGGTLAGLADPDALVAGGDAVGCVDACVARAAEVGQVGAAVDGAGSGAARVADACPVTTGDAIFAFFHHISLSSLCVGQMLG